MSFQHGKKLERHLICRPREVARGIKPPSLHSYFQHSWIVLDQTWANYGPRAKSGSLVLLFWPAGIYTKLNSHRELNGRPFIPLEIMNDSDFQKNKPQRCKIGIKNEKNKVKTFYFGDHIRTKTVISKKKKGFHLAFQ